MIVDSIFTDKIKDFHNKYPQFKINSNTEYEMFNWPADWQY